jgi:hypothetical protein
MQIYCLHHIDVPERKEILLKAFEHQKMNVTWVETFHPKDIDRTKLDIRHKLNDGALSLYLKHKYVFEQQKEHQYENILILEDDVMLPDYLNFNVYLEECLDEFKKLDGDIMFVGGGLGIVPRQIFPNQKVYYEPHFRSRCTHCFVVNIKAIDKILKDINIIDDAIDWKLNHIIANEKLRCCYVEPAIYQATVEGKMKSLIQ